jgi:hypothetical protein
VYLASDADVPTAVLVNGTFGTTFNLEVTVSGNIGASCDIPVLSIPVPGLQGGLYLHIGGDVTGSFSFGVQANGLSVSLEGLGWVDGQTVGQAEMTCNGSPISLADLSSSGCLTVPTSIQLTGNLEVGPEFEFGPVIPDVATAEFGVID